MTITLDSSTYAMIEMDNYTEGCSVEISHRGKKYDYAYIQNASDLSIEKLISWIKETYYDMDFLSDQYIACKFYQFTEGE